MLCFMDLGSAVLFVLRDLHACFVSIRVCCCQSDAVQPRGFDDYGEQAWLMKNTKFST
jgi:hypothetical protein